MREQAVGIDDDNGAGTPAGTDDRPAGYDVVVAETLMRDAKRIAELEAALRGVVGHWREFSDMMFANTLGPVDDYGMSERIDAVAKLIRE